MARQSFITNSNLTQILETGHSVSKRFGGVSVECAFLRNGTVPSDTDLSVAHDTVNIMRVNFSTSDRYNALELTVTARSAYVAYGDHAPESIKALLSGYTTERKTEWVMKNKVLFPSVADMCAIFAVAETAVRPMERYSELWELCNRDYATPTPTQAPAVTGKNTKKRNARKKKEVA